MPVDGNRVESCNVPVILCICFCRHKIALPVQADSVKGTDEEQAGHRSTASRDENISPQRQLSFALEPDTTERLRRSPIKPSAASTAEEKTGGVSSVVSAKGRLPRKLRMRPSEILGGREEKRSTAEGRERAAILKPQPVMFVKCCTRLRSAKISEVSRDTCSPLLYLP